MNSFICTIFLFFGFGIGDLICQKNKLPGASFSVSGNNIPTGGSRSHGINFDDLIRILLKFVRDANSDEHNPTNSSVRNAQGKSKGTDESIIPFVLFLKFIGALLLTLATVKFFLFKGVFGAKFALIVLGIIFARKLPRFGTLMLLKNHQFYFENGLGQYPTNEPNLSGYGYEYNFVPGFQTPEQKYSSVTGKEENKRQAKLTK